MMRFAEIRHGSRRRRSVAPAFRSERAPARPACQSRRSASCAHTSRTLPAPADIRPRGSTPGLPGPGKLELKLHQPRRLVAVALRPLGAAQLFGTGELAGSGSAGAFHGASLPVLCCHVNIMNGLTGQTGRTNHTPARAALDLPGVGPVGADGVFLDRLLDGLGVDRAIVGKRLERGNRDVAAIDFEEIAQCGADVASAVAVGAERDIPAWYPVADQVRYRAHVIAGGDHRAGSLFQALLDPGLFLVSDRVQAVMAFDADAVAAQFGEAGNAPHIGADVPVAFQQFRRCEHLAQDRPRTQELDLRGLLFSSSLAPRPLSLADAVHSFQNPF